MGRCLAQTGPCAGRLPQDDRRSLRLAAAPVLTPVYCESQGASTLPGPWRALRDYLWAATVLIGEHE